MGLSQALPAAPVLPPHSEAEEVVMRDADISNLGRGGHGGRSGATHEDDDDDEEGRGGQRVQVQILGTLFIIPDV